MKKLFVFIATFISSVSFSQDFVTDYYNEIASHSEYAIDGITSFTPKKWKTDVKIFVKGVRDSVTYSELIKVIAELNDLIDSIEIKITENESEANLIAFFGWFIDYDKIEPNAERFTSSNYGLACVYAGNDNDWYKGSFYVDIVRCNWFPAEESSLLKKHIVREELTQSLGLLNDSMKYPDSIFYQKWSLINEYSELDKKIIKMHYAIN